MYPSQIESTVTLADLKQRKQFNGTEILVAENNRDILNRQILNLSFRIDKQSEFASDAHEFELDSYELVLPENDTDRIILNRFYRISDETEDQKNPQILVFLKDEPFNFELIPHFEISLRFKEKIKNYTKSETEIQYHLMISVENHDDPPLVNKSQEESGCRVSLTDEDEQSSLFFDLNNVSFTAQELECADERNETVEAADLLEKKEFGEEVVFSVSNTSI